MDREELLKTKKIMEIAQHQSDKVSNLFFPDDYCDAVNIDLDEEWTLKALKESGHVDVSVKGDFVGIMHVQTHGENELRTLLVRDKNKNKKS